LQAGVGQFAPEPSGLELGITEITITGTGLWGQDTNCSIS
jgi:hypothetical protein